MSVGLTDKAWLDLLNAEKARAEKAEARTTYWREAAQDAWRMRDSAVAVNEADLKDLAATKEALAAARRECEASKADLTTLLEFVRYVICPVCAADHVRVENGIVRGHPPLDRRAAGDGNRCTASRGSILDVIRDASQARVVLAAPAAGEEGK